MYDKECDKKNYSIREYSKAALIDVVSNELTSQKTVEKKDQIDYLHGYLTSDEIEVKTILIECDYLSRDFLTDYFNYYAESFVKLPKFCRRVHFFRTPFDGLEEKIEQIIVSPSEENSFFWDNYIGFVIVRPIPSTLVGITILNTYQKFKKQPGREFWGVRQYKAHVFGHELTLESLAFQEQDGVVAACATTAVWCLLQKASESHHAVLKKSSSQITKDAGSIDFDGNRIFPNNGLNIFQICKTLTEAGLETEVKRSDIESRYGLPYGTGMSINRVKAILNAYAPLGIPIIAVVAVPNNDDYGLHAITISGHLKTSNHKSIPRYEDIKLLSSNVKIVYGHDDQYGPFERIDLDEKFDDQIGIFSPWSYTKPTYFYSLIISVFPEIKVSFEDIFSMTTGLNEILEPFFNMYFKGSFNWDIQLVYSEKYKTSIIKAELPWEQKIRVTTKNMPKYVWLAKAFFDDDQLIDFVFDSTSFHTTMNLLAVVIHKQTVGRSIASQFRNQAARKTSPFYIRNSDMLLKRINEELGM